MVSITQALRRIKGNLACYFDPAFIEGVVRELGHEWRDRILDPTTTLCLFLLQIIHRNTACHHLAHLAAAHGMSASVNHGRRPFTASAYCQARNRLPRQLIALLALKTSGALREDVRAARFWHGHRTILIDGSSFSMPDTPVLQAHFGQPGGQKKGCGFPVAHMLAAFDARTGFLLDLFASPLRTHEMSQVGEMHKNLLPGDLLLGDRGFCSYVHLAFVLKGQMHACFRMHQRQIVCFRPHRRASSKNVTGRPRSRWLKRLGVCDQVVAWIKPEQKPTWISTEEFEALPPEIEVRELKYKVGPRGFRVREVILVTTLLDAEKYSASDLAELYRMRWQVETNLRHLKITLNMDILHCKTVDGVMKEMWMFALVYNLVRRVMLDAAAEREAAIGKPVEPDRISFVDAARWLLSAVMNSTANPTDTSVIPLASLIINPDRRDRIEPRVIKRRMKEYLLMKKPREKLRQDMIKGKLVA